MTDTKTADPYANLTNAQVSAAVETLRAAGVETVAGCSLSTLEADALFCRVAQSEHRRIRALIAMRADLLRAERRLAELDELCPRCRRLDCSPECLAAEQAEENAYDGPMPRKFA